MDMCDQARAGRFKRRPINRVIKNQSCDNGRSGSLTLAHHFQPLTQNHFPLICIAYANLNLLKHFTFLSA